MAVTNFEKLAKAFKEVIAKKEHDNQFYEALFKLIESKVAKENVVTEIGDVPSEEKVVSEVALVGYVSDVVGDIGNLIDELNGEVV